MKHIFGPPQTHMLPVVVSGFYCRGPRDGALPGYVAQQQMGMGNNEMAWYVHYVLLLLVFQLY